MTQPVDERVKNPGLKAGAFNRVYSLVNRLRHGSKQLLVQQSEVLPPCDAHTMLNRQNIAGFLQGLFVLPLCALFGLMFALLFQSYYHRHWGTVAQTACVALFALFPLFGALRTRQRALTAGLLAGLAVTIAAYFGLRPHA